jgi:hypothetical protein
MNATVVIRRMCSCFFKQRKLARFAFNSAYPVKQGKPGKARKNRLCEAWATRKAGKLATDSSMHVVSILRIRVRELFARRNTRKIIDMLNNRVHFIRALLMNG